MGITVVTPPSAWPVSLDEAKDHCKIDGSAEDGYVTGLIGAATAHTEKVLGKSLMEQTLRLTLDGFNDAIRLPRGPVRSVVSIKYFDAAFSEQTLSPSIYTVDTASNPQWIVRNSDVSWPQTANAINTVNIDYVAGFNPLPDDIRHAILLLIGMWHRGRDEAALPHMDGGPAYYALLTNHRSYGF